MTLDPLQTALPELHGLHERREWAGLRDRSQELLAVCPSTDQRTTAELAFLLAQAEEGLQLTGPALANYTLSAELYSEPGDETLALRSQLGVARVHVLTGAMEQALHIAAEVCETATSRGWELQRALAQAVMGRALERDHRYAEALPLLREATQYLAQHGPPFEWHSARQNLAWALIGSGSIGEAETEALNNLEQLEAAGAGELPVLAELNVLVFAAWCRRDFGRIAQLQQRMLELESRIGRPAQIMALHYNMALTRIALMEFAAAKRSMHRAWDLARREGETRLLAPIQMALALVAIHDEQPDMAVEYAELARDNLRDHHSHETVLVRYYLALAYLTAGKAALARLEWAARAPLEPSIENGVEVAWLLRAIAAWQEQVQRANLAQDAETLDLARLMQEQLAEDANEQQQKSDERGRR